MIDIEKTINLRGYDPLMLSYGFGKKVWVICNECRKGRWLNFQGYSDLCRKCAKNLPEAKESVSIQFKKYYSDPEHCKENSDRRIEHFKNNPEAREAVSVQFKEYYSDIDNRKAKSDQMIQYYIDHPEARIEISKTVKKYLENHPEAVDVFIARMKVYWDNQNHRDERSIISSEWHKSHPEFSIEHSKFMIEYWANQSNRNDQSNLLKNSDAMKIQAEIMRGGDDIVNHHYLYDHSDLLKNTVKMTRSDHSRLHWLLWRLGVDVPHINM